MVQSVSLALLTFIRAYRNPQALKTFGLCCCYGLRPYLNTVHTPTCPECNTNGSYRATWNYSVSDSFILGFNTVGSLSCLSFWPQRWLAGDSLWPDQDWSVARPQGASAMVVTHVALAWNQCFLCFKYVEFVHRLSDSTCWASSRDRCSQTCFIQNLVFHFKTF